ncbi:hypothetical protein FA13DRAFT_1809699 [Coprinellus micaceus]|uniref:Uncharacterized protein n=1 Tax=Coprinellus micaceus TaxID=71717 RepID=A0A4Y7TWY0_COPMI|nr:hypothetical protein FA13DRAFT_1809699 [Coprinellus micaceus]
MSSLVAHVNSQRKAGVFATMARMYSTLQAEGHTDAAFDWEALHRTVLATAISFTWMNASEIMDDPDPDAYAAVVFTAHAPREGQVQLLTYILSRFHELKSNGWGTANLTMVDVYFEFTGSTLYGAMIYDHTMQGCEAAGASGMLGQQGPYVELCRELVLVNKDGPPPLEDIE